MQSADFSNWNSYSKLFLSSKKSDDFGMFIEVYLIGILIGKSTNSDFWFSMILGFCYVKSAVFSNKNSSKKSNCSPRFLSSKESDDFRMFIELDLIGILIRKAIDFDFWFHYVIY